VEQYTRDPSKIGEIVQKLYDEGCNGRITVYKSSNGHYFISGISQGEIYAMENSPYFHHPFVPLVRE
jgi:hypothetical protein